MPVVIVPESAAATFMVPASDPDGDAIRWRMSTNAEAGGGAHPPTQNMSHASRADVLAQAADAQAYMPPIGPKQGPVRGPRR